MKHRKFKILKVGVSLKNVNMLINLSKKIQIWALDNKLDNVDL